MNRKPLLTLAALALSGSLVFAQAPSTPAPAAAATPEAAPAPVERRPPQGMHRGMPQVRSDMRGRMQGRDSHSDFHRSSMSHSGPRDSFHGRPSGFQGGGMSGDAFHIAPPGMWWKNPSVVQRLTLTADQTKKMDDIFQQARIQLIDLHANVEKQNVLLEPMLSANPPDTAKTLAQIDKVAQARADLEKADARMLLGIRGVLTPEQWTKLRSGGGFGRPGGQGGAEAPGQQGGPGGGRGPRIQGGAGLGADNFVAPIFEP